MADFTSHVADDSSILHLVGRALSGAAGVATIPTLFAATGMLFSRRVASIAAAFLSVAFLHVRDSHFGVTDVPMTLLVVCAFWAATHCAVRGITFPRVIVAGIVCGLAAATKYNALLILTPTLAVIAADMPRCPLTRTFDTLAALGLGAVIGFLAGTPFAVLDAQTFVGHLAEQRQLTFAGEFAGVVGSAITVYGERGWIHHLTYTLRYGLGLPLLGAALIGAAWLASQRSRTAAVVLAFAIIYYIVMGDTFEVFTRYMTPVVPFLCVTAAFFVDRTSQLVGHALNNMKTTGVVAVVLTVLIGGPTAAHSLAFDRLIARTDTRLLAAQWLEAHFPAGASMYQTGAFYGHVQPRPRDRYVECAFDERTERFQCGAPRVDAPLVLDRVPEVVLRVDSPLRLFNHVPDQLDRALRSKKYVLATTLAGAPAGTLFGTAYDQQDAFFAPFANVPGLKHPGPTISIFERRER
jgi:4-amino-4-deoxy-L-arabinose transferase-like glycosyltransferase